VLTAPDEQLDHALSLIESAAQASRRQRPAPRRPGR